MEPSSVDDDVASLNTSAAKETDPTIRPKRKRLGRASRRRTAKLKSLEQQLALLRKHEKASTTTTVDTSNTTLSTIGTPKEQEQTWAGVHSCREKQGFSSLSTQDSSDLIQQLSYHPGNILSVVAYHNSNLDRDATVQQKPLVLQLYPLSLRHRHVEGHTRRKYSHKSRARGSTKETDCGVTKDGEEASNNTNYILEPFPTIYWLTHTIIKTYVSQLELQDYVRIFEERLQKEPQSLESMMRAHDAYAKHRWSLLVEEDQQLVQDRNGWADCLKNKGIAGINFTGQQQKQQQRRVMKVPGIKCLHAHVAHNKSGGPGSQDNVVGQWTWKLVQERMQRNDTACEADEAGP